MYTIEGVPVYRLELHCVVICKSLTNLKFNTRGDREPVKIPQDWSNNGKILDTGLQGKWQNFEHVEAFA